MCSVRGEAATTRPTEGSYGRTQTGPEKSGTFAQELMVRHSKLTMRPPLPTQSLVVSVVTPILD